MAVVATSVVVLSNDIYLYPFASFHKATDINGGYSSQSTNYKTGYGWAFGFRKRFNHSALEYGISSVQNRVEYTYFDGSKQVRGESKIGGHFNYVHQIFYNRTPSRLKVYLGPSVNYVYDFGYGGIIGTDIKLFDRLSFDLRYELTTQTNRIQAGFIFTYQKKYFWQKNRR